MAYCLVAGVLVVAGASWVLRHLLWIAIPAGVVLVLAAGVLVWWLRGAGRRNAEYAAAYAAAFVRHRTVTATTKPQVTQGTRRPRSRTTTTSTTITATRRPRHGSCPVLASRPRTRGAGAMSTPVKWLVFVFVAWWVIKDPTSAAHMVSRLGDFATHAAGSLTTVLSSI